MAGEGIRSAIYRGPAMPDFWTESKGGESRMVVIGHRGCGQNQGPSPRPSIMENTLLSFNTAAWVGAHFVEFDVQVTKDGHPVIFHDDLLIVQDAAERILSRRVADITLHEFLSIGYQKGPNACKAQNTLLRQRGDGSLAPWNSTLEDSLCTLEEAFQRVLPTIGFNIELKFDDYKLTPDSELRQAIKSVLKIVEQYATKERKLFFSSFHPDAVRILTQEQSTHPVFFLTDGGVCLYNDPRRNSIEAAVEVCKEGGLQGIVSEVEAIMASPEKARHVKEAGLSLLTYGELK